MSNTINIDKKDVLSKTFKGNNNIITLNINGKKVEIDVQPDEYLVDTLRRVGNLSVKRGCDTGCCGLCSIWLDGKPTLSCSTLSIRANNKNITTIEGLEKEASELKSALVQQLYVRILRVLLCVWFSPELWFSAKHCEV